MDTINEQDFINRFEEQLSEMQHNFLQRMEDEGREVIFAYDPLASIEENIDDANYQLKRLIEKVGAIEEDYQVRWAAGLEEKLAADGLI